MAGLFQYNDPHVGDIVYMSFSPVQVGRITRVIGQKTVVNVKTGAASLSPFYDVVVVFKRKGKLVEETVDSGRLRCYRTLLADHQRKADKMAAMLQDVLSWAP